VKQLSKTFYIDRGRQEHRDTERLNTNTNSMYITSGQDKQLRNFLVPGQVKAHVVLTCTNGVALNHLHVIAASDRP